MFKRKINTAHFKIKGFSLVELLWSTFLLATAILVITGVIISALNVGRKSSLMVDAANVLSGEKAKIESKGYQAITGGDSYVSANFYVIYDVDDSYDYDSETISPVIKVVSLGIYNVPDTEIDKTSKDKLTAVKTTLVLFYKP